VVLASPLLFTGEGEGKITGEGEITGEGSAAQKALSPTGGEGWVRGIKFTKELGFLPPHLTFPPVGQRDIVVRHRFA